MMQNQENSNTACKFLNPRCNHSLRSIMMAHDSINLMIPPNSWVLWIDTDSNKGHLYRLSETGTRKLNACHKTFGSEPDKTAPKESFGYFFTGSSKEDIKSAFLFFIELLCSSHLIESIINKDALLQTIGLYQDLYLEKKIT